MNLNKLIQKQTREFALYNKALKENKNEIANMLLDEMAIHI